MSKGHGFDNPAPLPESSRPIANADIAAVFEEIADLLELQGANAFRIRAYRNAAQMLGALGRDMKAMVERGEKIDALPGIGADLAGKIAEVVATGTCEQLGRLRAEMPPAITELLKIRGLGPKRVRALYQELGVKSLEELRRAAETGRIHTVHGFGETSQRQILEEVSERLQSQPRMRLNIAEQVADSQLSWLLQVPGVQKAVAAGSLRRMRDSVGDIDLLVVAGRDCAVMDRFAVAADMRRVLSRGTTRASVLLPSGLQVDLRTVAPESFGAAWLYFTGSRAHNIALRALARSAGLKLNEYGVYRGDKRIAGETEASVYRALGMRFIEPELREDRGEIVAARAGRLPHLVQPSDLRGDLHAHTTESDGHDTLEAMAEAARARGLQYLAITDHSRRLTVAHGLDAGRLARQIDRIDALNARSGGVRVLKGIEVDILEDGSLDLPLSVLRRLDLVVGAIHHRFDLSREKQTLRLQKAMDCPCFSVLAHPTGRLIGERPACDIDLPRLIRHAAQRGCFLELNAHPARLDLGDMACRMAKDGNVLVSIASDAHSTLELDNVRFGVGQARRGWLEASDVLNTRTLDELLPLLDLTMGRGPQFPRRTTSIAPVDAIQAKLPIGSGPADKSSDARADA